MSKSKLIFKGPYYELLQDSTGIISKHLVENNSSSLKTELDLIESGKFPFLPEIESADDRKNPSLIRFKYFEAEPLEQLMRSGNLEEETKYKIAISIILLLDSFHREGLVLLDLQPSMLFYGINSNTLKFTGAYFSSDLDSEAPEKLSMDLNSLIFICPEQTHRTSLEMDYRGNYYTAGIILYLLFTDILPFRSKDPMKLVHMHLAKVAVEPLNIMPNPSKPISDIILKMLEKNPENRYQSSEGIIHDLNLALKAFIEGKTEEGIRLGEEDFTKRFTIEDDFSENRSDIDFVKRALSKQKNRSKGFLSIHAPDGFGKTSLIKGVEMELFGQGFHFFWTDTLGTPQVPYSIILELTNQLIGWFQTFSSKKQSSIKEDLNARLGTLGNVLIEFNPAFGQVLDQSAEYQIVEGLDAQNRFSLSISHFLKVFTTDENVVVLVIENIDNNDVSAFSLLEYLLADPELQNLFLIGTLNNEQMQDRFLNFSENISQLAEKSSRLNYEKLVLLPIEKDKIEKLFLGFDEGEAAAISQYLEKRTGGNPYFLRRSINHLLKEKVIFRDSESKLWKFDWDKAIEIPSTDSVLEYLESKIKRLSGNTLALVKIAACAGREFSLDLIHHLTDFAEDQVHTSISELVDDGFLDKLVESKLSGSYRFSHPRLILVTVGVMERDEKIATKKGILDYYLSKLEHQDLLKSQFSLAEYVLDLPVEFRLEYNHLVLEAGDKAFNQAAFDKAFQYYQSFFETFEYNELKPENPFDQYLRFAESSVYAQKFDEFEILLPKLEQYADDILHTIEIYCLKVLRYNIMGQHEKAVRVSLDGLKQCGIKLSFNPSLIRIIFGLIRLKIQTRDLDEKKILSMNLSNDSFSIKYSKLIILSLSAAYLAAPKLISLLTEILIRNTKEKGLYPSSPNALILYGFLQTSFTNDIERGYQFALTGTKLFERFQTPQLEAHSKFTYYSFVHHFKHPLIDTSKALHDQWRFALELGNINLAFYNLGLSQWYALFSGIPLKNHQKQVIDDLRYCEDFQQSMISYYHRIILQFIANMRAERLPSDNYLNGDYINFNDAEQKLKEGKDQVTLGNLYYMRIICGFMFGNNKYSEEYGEFILKLYNETGFSTPNSIVATFYILYSWMDYKPLTRKQKSTFRSLIRKFENWSKNAPVNYAVKYNLLVARYFQYKGKRHKAKERYEEAYNQAFRFDNIWDRAIASELRAKNHFEHGENSFGEEKIVQAYGCYGQWGAKSKQEQLRITYPDIDWSTYQIDQQDSSLKVTSEIDMNSILKATTTISGEIRLSSLVDQMLGIVIENVGAQRSVFLLKEDVEIYVYGEKSGSQPAKITKHKPDDEFIPMALIQYVGDSGKPVVIKDIKKDKVFGNSAYVRNNNAASVLCAPLLKNKKLLGIIYLENNLSSGLFTEERVDIIKMLSSQMAISIENSLLYENLEDKVQERTAELDAEKTKSDELIKNILPQQVADELKEHGQSKARYYDNVSVLFTDFKGFTEYSKIFSAEELVAEIDSCFSEFDKIISQYGIEKIKTIGDAYMCAGGLPIPDDEHAIKVVSAALDIRDFIAKRNQDQEKNNRPKLEIRLGVHSGPVVAGIVGTKKFAYDIWGDTVNTASRIESEGEAGKVNISSEVQRKIQDKFECTYRGAIEAKGKGKLEMFFVDRIQ